MWAREEANICGDPEKNYEHIDAHTSCYQS